MDRGVKISIAATIVLAGATLAILAGRDPAWNESLTTNSGGQLLLRGPVVPRPSSEASSTAVPRRATTTATVSPAAHPAKRPAKPDDPPLGRARSLPSWLSVVGPDARPVRHRVVDGDSLALLAKRYLGSAERQWEIFQANRDVMSSPGLLPIGAELKIPCAPPPAQ